MHRPRLKRTLDAVESAAGDIYILRPGADSDLVIEQPDGTARLCSRRSTAPARSISSSATSAASGCALRSPT